MKQPTIQLAVSTIATLGAFCFGATIRSDPPWEIRDSKGRVRLQSFEDGDAFGFSLLDQAGKRRVSLGCSPDGRPGIRMFDADGTTEVALWEHGHTGVHLVVCSPDSDPATIESGKGTGAAIAVGAKDGKCYALLAADRRERASGLLLSQADSDGQGKIKLTQKGRFKGELRFERDNDGIVGLACDRMKGAMWMGDDAMNGSAGGRGVRIVWDPELGGEITLRHTAEASGQLTLQESDKHGRGIHVRGKGRGVVQAGISAEGVPRIALTDMDGAKLGEIPQK